MRSMESYGSSTSPHPRWMYGSTAAPAAICDFRPTLSGTEKNLVFERTMPRAAIRGALFITAFWSGGQNDMCEPAVNNGFFSHPDFRLLNGQSGRSGWS